MAVIALPDKFTFKSVKTFKLQRASNGVRSRYSAYRQLIVYPYALWTFEGTLIDYDGEAAADIRAFLMLLEGQKNHFRLPVPGYSRPSTGYLGNALTNTAVAAGAVSMQVKGLTPSVPIIRKGEYFSYGDKNEELKIATSNVASDGSGLAVINFLPASRKVMSENQTTILQNPSILMHSTDDDVADWGLEAPVRHRININAVEVVEK